MKENEFKVVTDYIHLVLNQYNNQREITMHFRKSSEEWANGWHELQKDQLELISEKVVLTDQNEALAKEVEALKAQFRKLTFHVGSDSETTAVEELTLNLVKLRNELDLVLKDYPTLLGSDCLLSCCSLLNTAISQLKAIYRIEDQTGGMFPWVGSDKGRINLTKNGEDTIYDAKENFDE